MTFTLFLWLLLVYFVQQKADPDFLKACVYSFSGLTVLTFFIRDIMKPSSNLARILGGWTGFIKREQRQENFQGQAEEDHPVEEKHEVDVTVSEQGKEHPPQ